MTVDLAPCLSAASSGTEEIGESGTGVAFVPLPIELQWTDAWHRPALHEKLAF